MSVSVTNDNGAGIAARVEASLGEVVIPYQRDSRVAHGQCEDLVAEFRSKARAADVLTPRILLDGTNLSQRETATVLKKTGLSPLGPVACNTAAPDEGNMFLHSKIATAEERTHFLRPLIDGTTRPAFLLNEPAADGGAGSDPSFSIHGTHRF